jgi:ATP/ADP translocase
MTFSSAAAASLAASSTAVNQHLLLPKVFSISRGGALALATTSAASSAIFHSTQTYESDDSLVDFRGGSSFASGISEKGFSVLCMAIAMSLHYLSYSIARPSTIALFTSAKTGFAGNTAAFPLAMAFISPTSLMLLLLYGKILQKAGPRGAIRQTTCFCASMLWLTASLVFILQGMNPIKIQFLGGKSIQLIQLVVGVLFIFRESYVQLLTSQYWSFMASILTPDQSAKWFSPISGLTSITSAVAGLGVSNVVDKVGLPGALGIAGLILMSSLFFTERAYTISDKVSSLMALCRLKGHELKFR